MREPGRLSTMRAAENSSKQKQGPGSTGEKNKRAEGFDFIRAKPQK